MTMETPINLGLSEDLGGPPGPKSDGYLALPGGGKRPESPRAWRSEIRGCVFLGKKGNVCDDDVVSNDGY